MLLLLKMLIRVAVSVVGQGSGTSKWAFLAEFCSASCKILVVLRGLCIW